MIAEVSRLTGLDGSFVPTRFIGPEGSLGRFSHYRANEFISCRVEKHYDLDSMPIVFLLTNKAGEVAVVPIEDLPTKHREYRKPGWWLIELAIDKITRQKYSPEEFRRYIHQDIASKYYAHQYHPDTIQLSQKEPTSMEIDNVTLLQIEAGVRMAKASFNRNNTLYTFKVPADMELKKGDKVIASMNPSSYNKKSRGIPLQDDEPEVSTEEIGFAIVTFDSFDEDFEPAPGITYTWIVQKLDLEALSAQPRMDKTARKKLRLGAAISQARQQLGNVSIALLPGVTLENGEKE